MKSGISWNRMTYLLTYPCQNPHHGPTTSHLPNEEENNIGNFVFSQSYITQKPSKCSTWSRGPALLNQVAGKLKPFTEFHQTQPQNQIIVCVCVHPPRQASPCIVKGFKMYNMHMTFFAHHLKILNKNIFNLDKG